MAFNEQTLKNNLSTLFAQMKEDTSGDNTVFANGISTYISQFANTGSVSTTDAGTIAAGVFAGSGSGSMTSTPAACFATILAACLKMKTATDEEKEQGVYDNKYLAQEVGKGIQQMADTIVVSTTVAGTTTPSSGTPYTDGGQAQGQIQCNNGSLIQNLQTAFESMINDEEKDDDWLAGQIAQEVHTYFKQGSIVTYGQGNLQGSVGSGSVS